jgi:predicted CXXCH cytochrome family protein
MPMAPLRWIVPVGAGLLLAVGGVAAADGCITAPCHVTLLSQKTVHAAAEACETCHESTATPHPQAGKKTFKLSQEPPELCVACHDTIGTKPSVHAPVKDGMCTACHDPHATAEPKLLTQPAKDLCTACHEDQTKHANLHGPVAAGDCGACHAAHDSDVKPLLTKPADTLCLGCHVDVQEGLKKPHVHAAVESGCTTCHDPHGAAQAKLLIASGADLCVTCHADVGEVLAKAPAVHGALKLESGCASCHAPHAADHPKLLTHTERESCGACHAGVVPKNATALHGPVKDGTCTPCHEPHGGDDARLLVRTFPRDPYAAYSEEAYALCYGCHKPDLARYPDTSFATGFRDGERNLHTLHVNKPKGRSCILCHDTHAGTSPKLIAASVPFGGWSLPIKFVPSENGGSCAPGCHKPAQYDRRR